MWWFIKATLQGPFVDPSTEYFGLFPSKEAAEDYSSRVFDPEDIEVEYLQMVTVWEENSNGNEEA